MNVLLRRTFAATLGAAGRLAMTADSGVYSRIYGCPPN